MKAGLKVSMKVGLKVEDLCGRVYLWRKGSSEFSGIFLI